MAIGLKNVRRSVDWSVFAPTLDGTTSLIGTALEVEIHIVTANATGLLVLDNRITNLLKATPSISTNVVNYKLYYTPNAGTKIWDSSVGSPDYSLPNVSLGLGTLDGQGKLNWDLFQYPQLVGLSGKYDIGLTAVDAEGDESNFLPLEDAVFQF